MGVRYETEQAHSADICKCTGSSIHTVLLYLRFIRRDSSKTRSKIDTKRKRLGRARFAKRTNFRRGVLAMLSRKDGSKVIVRRSTITACVVAIVRSAQRSVQTQVLAFIAHFHLVFAAQPDETIGTDTVLKVVVVRLVQMRGSLGNTGQEPEFLFAVAASSNLAVERANLIRVVLVKVHNGTALEGAASKRSTVRGVIVKVSH